MVTGKNGAAAPASRKNPPEPVVRGGKPITEKVKFHVDLPGDLHQRAKIWCVTHGFSQKDMVIKAIEKMIDPKAK